jgi:hypothetical protein
VSLREFGNLGKLIQRGTYFQPGYVPPSLPDNITSTMQNVLTLEALKEHQKALDKMKNDRPKLFELIMQHFSAESKDEIRDSPDFEEWYAETNPEKLWQAIEIFIDISQGMHAEKEKCLTLKKSIFWIVQSARQHYMEPVEATPASVVTLKEAKLILANGSKNQQEILILLLSLWMTVSPLEMMKLWMKSLSCWNFTGLVSRSNSSCKIVQEVGKGKAWIKKPSPLERDLWWVCPRNASLFTSWNSQIKDCETSQWNQQNWRMTSNLGKVLVWEGHYIGLSTPLGITNILIEFSVHVESTTGAAFKELLREVQFKSELLCLNIQPNAMGSCSLPLIIIGKEMGRNNSTSTVSKPIF